MECYQLKKLLNIALKQWKATTPQSIQASIYIIY